MTVNGNSSFESTNTRVRATGVLNFAEKPRDFLSPSTHPFLFALQRDDVSNELLLGWLHVKPRKNEKGAAIARSAQVQ